MGNLAKPPFQTGDVFWAPDPYHDDDPALAGDAGRPWLVLSTEAYPDQGREYVCCALTSYRDDHAQLLRLHPQDWTAGAKRAGSQIDPTTVFTVHHDWTGRYLGRVASDKVRAARARLRSYL